MSFTPAASYPAGTNPQAIVTADFNNDGRLDLATANAGSSTVSLLRGNGDGTFQAALSSATGAGPQSVAVGDFNGDGTLDLATANAGGDVSVLTGNGDGTFHAPTNIVIRSGLTSVAVGDFNGDGKMDLGVASNTYYFFPEYGYGGWNGFANVLLGNGDGSFSTPTTTYTGGYARAVAVADFDGDAIDDLAILDGAYWSVNVLSGDVSGQLQGPWYASAAYYAWSLVAGDVDGDGDADLLTANRYVNDVAVTLNDGTGWFATGGNYPVGSEPTSVVLGDFDRDGKPDIATGYAAGNNVSVLRGRGVGDFGPAENFPAGPGPSSVAAGDFNGDGWLDLATANAGANGVSVLVNDRAWPPAPDSLSIGDVTVTEGTGGTVAAVFTVTRGGRLDGAATVDYSTADGGVAGSGFVAALAGSDYVARSGTLTFAAGVATMQVTIQINGDSTDEYDQGFVVNLSAASGAIVTDGQGFGAILDDDDAPTITITQKVSGLEGRKSNGKFNFNTTPFDFTVTLSAASEKEVSVGFATANGTATALDNDYVATSSFLSFAPGVTSGTIRVQVRGDSKLESDETFFVNLRNAWNATILGGQGVGEILNDDR